MPVLTDVVIKGTLVLPEVGGGPIIPPALPEKPPIIWGPPGPWPAPPIYVPIHPPIVGRPPDGDHVELPIWLPVFPMLPIVIPQPPGPPVVWPPLPPKPPLGIWGPEGPWTSPPIYIPVQPPGGGEGPPHVELPIYFPVFAMPPIYIPPDGGKPEPPPPMLNPPSALPGFWGYSLLYESYVFVPYSGVLPGPPEGKRGRG